MVKEIQYEILDDTGGVASKPDETPREFKARKEIIDGKEVLVVTTQNEVVIRPDGSKDVIIHAPSLDLLNKYQEENS